MAQIGDKAPAFTLPSTSGDFGLQQALGAVDYLIIAFYPKDNTSG